VPGATFGTEIRDIDSEMDGLLACREERPVFLLDGKSLGPLLRTAAEDA